MTDIVELKRKIAEYLDEYATVHFSIGDYSDMMDEEGWVLYQEEGDYKNIIKNQGGWFHNILL